MLQISEKLCHFKDMNSFSSNITVVLFNKRFYLKTLTFAYNFKLSHLVYM